MAYVAKYNATQTTIVARIMGLDTTYLDRTRTITWYINGMTYGTQSLASGVSYSELYTFSELKAGTTYTISARIQYWDAGGGVWAYAYPTELDIATEKILRPNTFAWTYTKSSGRSFNLTATEWNRLTDNINEVREYKGLSAYSFTTATRNNPFTATMYNQAITAINAMSSYSLTPYRVSRGDPVTADCLNLLRDEINAIQ